MTRRVVTSLVFLLLCQSALAMATPMACGEPAPSPPCHESMDATVDFADTADKTERGLDCEIRCAQAGAAALPMPAVAVSAPDLASYAQDTAAAYHSPDPHGIFHPPIDL